MTVSEPGETREWVAYVGSRTTTARGAQGKGLSMYSVDAVSGVWRLRQVVEGLVNPSYMILNRAQDRLYAVHGDQTEVSSFVVERDDGTLRFLNRQSCGGANPVHLELSMDERRLVVANYATGTLSSLGIAGDGALEPVAALLGLPGKPGPHRVEQNGSHPHHVRRFTAHGQPTPWHIVPDKGLDAVFAVQWGTSAADTRMARFQSRESAGPRHAAFSPSDRLVYVANELDSTVTTLAFDPDAGAFSCLGHASTLPGNYSGENRVAGIVAHPSGRMIYVSNRGHDSVACLPVETDGTLSREPCFVSALGEVPRFITLTPDGRHLLIANERSHTLVIRALDDATLVPIEEARIVGTGSPVCVVFREGVVN
jgi:6-phosphogluconolactonase